MKSIPGPRDGLIKMRTELVVIKSLQSTHNSIREWIRKKGYRVKYYSWGYIKLKIGSYYSAPLIIFYICTFWIGAIIHYAIRSDLGTLKIYIYPYRGKTLLVLEGEGRNMPAAMKSLQVHLKAKKGR